MYQTINKTLLNIAVSAALATIINPVFAQETTPAGAAPAAALAARGAPTDPKPFKEVIKDAKEIAGFFKTYRKDEKVWLEVKPDQLDVPFFFSYNVTQSMGERGNYGSQMGRSHLVFLRKIGNQIQMVAMNNNFRATPNTPMAHTVAQGFAQSLISSAPVVSKPDDQSKAVLIEANALLLKDIPMYSLNLENAFRLPYSFDASHSHFSNVRGTELANSFNVNAHYAIPKLSPPPLTPSPVPTPPPPTTLSDTRSAFIGFHYSFAKLPTPMQPREADSRVGYFTSSFSDYSDDITPTARKHFAKRWRLEKQDANAAMSPPKEPITFWLDKNIPLKYRDSVRAGVLDWNKAFERIGFKDAIVVKQQTETDDFDTLDSRHASVRWFVGADVGFAIGPSHMDPRTGEILDADIGMSDVFARGARRLRVEEVAQPSAHTHADGSMCTFAHEAIQELDFAHDLLEARGDLAPDGPEADALAQAYVKDVMIHEVGHTLGLRHNYRSSTIYTPAQLTDPEFTKKNSMGGSIMDYVPYNIAAKGEKQGEYVASTIGPYDYWAIEYGYKQFAPGTEKAELQKVLARSAEPLLAYATDEDAGFGAVEGMDPEVNRFDIGSDPLAYVKKRMELSRELWERMQNKKLKEGESYLVLRRNFLSGFNAIARVAPFAARYVGGVKHVRDHAGTGRIPFTPVPAEKQREALTLVTSGLLSMDSFNFKPEFLRSLGVDHFERFNATSLSQAINPVVSVPTVILTAQRTILDQLMSDIVAQRIVDSEMQVADGKAFRLSELYSTTQNAIWSELGNGKEITSMRRNLQREHLKRIVGTLLKPSTTISADVVSLQRMNARTLLARLRAAQGKGKLSAESIAHITESAASLDEALKAPMQRAGV